MRSRNAFTLVELLVVVTVMVILAGIVLAFYPKSGSQTTQIGVTQLQVHMSSLKSMSQRNGDPHGIRLTDTGYLTIATPGRIAPIDPTVKTGIQGPLTVYLECTGGSNVVKQVGYDLQVSLGDYLEIVDVTPSIHRIKQIATVIGSNPPITYLTLACGEDANGNLNLEDIPNVCKISGCKLKDNYRYIRQPQPLMGEYGHQLPDGCVINFVKSRNLPLDGNGNYQIMFGPSNVINGLGANIVLWVEDTYGKASSYLLVINVFTGRTNVVPEGPTGDPYRYTRE